MDNRKSKTLEEVFLELAFNTLIAQLKGIEHPEYDKYRKILKYFFLMEKYIEYKKEFNHYRRRYGVLHYIHPRALKIRFTRDCNRKKLKERIFKESKQLYLESKQTG
jgi:hypothetical protein